MRDNKISELTSGWTTKNPYKGYFLSHNDWLIVGYKTTKSNSGFSTNLEFKYYESGTFYNRFNKLSFKDYILVNHNIDCGRLDPDLIDKKNGIFSFYGSLRTKNSRYEEYGFYKYDFYRDEVSLISDYNKEKRQILDYNNQTNNLLITLKKYYNSGINSPQKIVLLKKGKLQKINGLYKFAKFSNNGDYILLISSKNEVLIKNTNTLSTIYTDILKDGDYKIFAMHNQSFTVSNKYTEISVKKCNESSKNYRVLEDEEVRMSHHNCLQPIDIASKNETVAVILKNLGLIVRQGKSNKKTIKFEYSEFPEKVTLNKNADRMMIYFNNGKIKIYETKTFKVLIEMLHPNLDSHIFLNADNYYFSNINPSDYLTLKINGRTKTFSALGDKYFNPSMILKSFGQVDQEYLDLLEKALALRKKNKYENTIIKPPKHRSATTPNHQKGNLYMLAVGVSDYKQSDYDLTFADKDALDMAMIYHTFDSIELNKYRNKFFSTPYELIKNSSGIDKIINVYEDEFSVFNLKLLSNDANIWLENDHGKFYLWDFNSQTREPFNLPFFISDIWQISDNPIFRKNDNSGFVIFNDKKIYEYNFIEKTFTKIKLPFQFSRFSNELLEPIDNQKWISFNEEIGVENMASIQYAVTDGSITDSLSFNLNNYFYYNKDNILKQKSNSVYSVDFQAISSNGQYLVYTFENDIFYVNLEQRPVKPIKTKIPEDVDFSTKLSISEDGKTIAFHSDDYKTNLMTFKTYDIQGNLKSNIQLNKKRLAIRGVAVNNAKLTYIKEGKPLIKKYFNTEMNQELLSQAQPSSFKKTKVKYLINEKATLANIKKELKTITQSIQPNDQLVVFMAGHGVLNKELNYYFAPHNMDFEDVTNKGFMFEEIVNLINLANTSNKLLLLDTCHAGNVINLQTGKQVSFQSSNDDGKRGSMSRTLKKSTKFKLSDVISDVFEDFLSKSGITVISASAGEDLAYENKSLGNGAFTAAYKSFLLEQLAGLHNPYLDEKDLKNTLDFKPEYFSEILKKVAELTEGKQIPDLREINQNANLKMW